MLDLDEIKKEKQEIRLKPLSNPQPSTISKARMSGQKKIDNEKEKINKS